MSSEFISEKIKAVTATMDTARMAAGEPGLPREFIWRGKRLKVQKVLRQWKDTKACTHGSTDKYVNKFWYELETDSGTVAKVYFLRPRKGNLKDAGWWLLSMEQKN